MILGYDDVASLNFLSYLIYEEKAIKISNKTMLKILKMSKRKKTT